LNQFFLETLAWGLGDEKSFFFGALFFSLLNSKQKSNQLLSFLYSNIQTGKA